MDIFEYTKMPLSIFPDHISRQYHLEKNEKRGFVYLEIRKAIYGLPSAGRLANLQLQEKLKPYGYYEVPNTPGLWKHTTRPVQSTLVVDDFGVNYVGRENGEHLIQSLRKAGYELSIDWEGKLYCGVTLQWDYEQRSLTILMPNYIKKLLDRFKHIRPQRPVHTPYKPPPKTYGIDSQKPTEEDTSKLLDKKGIQEIQQIVGAILYYARAIDCTVGVALITISSEQTKATETTRQRAKLLLDYLVTHPNAEIKFYASDMILNVHSDISYLSETRARSRVGGYYFLGSEPQENEPISLNGNVYTLSTILKFVVASAAEAELGALLHNAKKAKIIRLALQELGHPQPPTPIHCDNKTAVGIADNSIKKQRSRSMEIIYLWISDQVNRQKYKVQWHPGQENLADYLTKHFEAWHHIAVRPWYLHMENSPRVLPQANAPSYMKDNAGTLPNGYVKTIPRPRI